MSARPVTGSWASRFEEIWYGGSPLALALLPLSWIYALVAAARQRAYASGLLPSARLPAPVIVVGNVTVGGTGKTPLVVWLVEFLRAHGWHPGVVSRGYGGRARHWPQQVRADSDPVMVGDEPVLIAQRTRCPVAAGPDRAEAVAALLEHHACDVVVSDDGLQHYALARDVEIAVIDGVRRFGNGQLLPAGPLREPAGRVRRVDMTVANGLAGRGEFAMQLRPGALMALGRDRPALALQALQPREVHAVAGIANPERFFETLRAAGLRVHRHPFADHHRFAAADLQFGDRLPVVMTEKDAVKCRRFAARDHWYLPVSAVLPEVFGRRLLTLLERFDDDGQTPA